MLAAIRRASSLLSQLGLNPLMVEAFRDRNILG